MIILKKKLRDNFPQRYLKLFNLIIPALCGLIHFLIFNNANKEFFSWLAQREEGKIRRK